MTEIQHYWENFWDERKDNGSQNDLIFQRLSHEKIYRYLISCKNLLIIGCGDGDGIELYQKKAEKITGIDFSKSAIEKAQLKFPSHKFFVADMLNSGLKYNSYDTIISERSITNLDSVEKQKDMLNEIHKLLSPDGILYLCEPSLQGYDEVDSMRLSIGLEKIKRHWHNILLDENLIFTSKKFRIVRKYYFGLYTLISRIIYPLYIYPDQPMFDDKMNKVAFEMSDVLFDYGASIPSQHVLYILEKV